MFPQSPANIYFKQIKKFSVSENLEVKLLTQRTGLPHSELTYTERKEWLLLGENGDFSPF